MEVTAVQVKTLRHRTGAGVMDCKWALQKSEGDVEQAIDLLRQKGLSDAAKKSERVATEGLVASYIHPGGKVGVLLEVNCETDFVAKTPQFQGLVKDIALQVAASAPLGVRQEDLDPEVVDRERGIYHAQAQETGKPEAVISRIVQGRLDKFYRESVLLEQAFVKDPDKNVETLVKEKIAELGENISIRRFVRFQLGEGMDKAQKDFAEEVKEQLGKT